MSISKDKLLISSKFYSVQGEGISSGVPSYFIRLGLCNLTCGFSRKHTNSLLKEKSLQDGEVIMGDLHKEGKASWSCDSLSQWLWRGEDTSFQKVIDDWKEQGIYEDIKNGTIHIIWTGGEPTIKGHQEAIINFSKYWEQQDEEVFIIATNPVTNIKSIFYEIETNGTIYIDTLLLTKLKQINCSPKLSNSGLSAKQRIVPEAIKRIMEHPNYQFKFVISNEDDIKEMFKDFIEPFNIPLKNVVCMPGLDSREEFHERTKLVFEMSKIYKFRAASRMHISCWDKTLNV